MSNTHEWTEEQVAAALADLLDQPHPTTDNPTLQSYLDTFQQLQSLSENPADFFQKELAWLIIGQETKDTKANRTPWFTRLRSAFAFSWRPSPRLALGLAVLIAAAAWLFWPVSPTADNTFPTDVEQRLSYSYGFDSPSTSRFEMLVDGNLAFFRSNATMPGGDAAAPPDVAEQTVVPALITSDGFAMNQPQTRMVQQEAALNLIVEDVPATVEQITDLAFAKEGYLISMESGQTTSGNPRATVQLRVPAEQLFGTLTVIKAMGLEVVSENITSEDVTAQYVDLNARLRNLQVTETEIGDLLATAQDRGESSQEILRIYDDLNGIREEIEVLQGQIQYLEQTVAMSLISVNLATEPEEVEEEIKPHSFDAGETTQKAWVNFINIWQDIATVLIWLIVHAPFVLLPLGIVWFIRYRNRTNR